MFNVPDQQQQDLTLDDVIRTLQSVVDEFEYSMWTMFHSEDELSKYQKQRIADHALEAAGLDRRSEEQYEQWGIFACETAGDIHKIIDEYIQYRKDKAAGNL